ncbi:uroporphyrinogen-III C-methyltransferase [Magnetospira sp. QH-2]|uniref:uroporphyrinogen-III C-methyltransferase n=1 Tax=Magnetospira sp. (strain QH-2) TaxID=1288970 RepID=UPI0003E81AE4|nr:uroporphyrinogen-III C-methyltransferase [Magnetospira sp. QH-2]CCQ74015.1 Uroporphyrinogen-III methylase [Magnetospira sp. QH-2]
MTEEQSTEPQPQSPCVALVGAGPGDPDLLTVKALRLIQEADVVVYDRLVSEEIMDLIPAGATRIFAGKAALHHHMKQDDINETLVNLAKSGRRVVRLKGGDPFIFGRGSEEAMYLAEHGICFQIVPGITASAGCTAYAGIPLTHRGLATGVRIVTGHVREGEELDLDWAGLADPNTTLVIYMGLTNVERITRELIANGLSPEIPSAAVQSGTTPRQRSVTAPLSDLAAVLDKEQFKAPSLLVIGRVVALADTLAWKIPQSACDIEAHG